jgi:hypothetical protein
VGLRVGAGRIFIRCFFTFVKIAAVAASPDNLLVFLENSPGFYIRQKTQIALCVFLFLIGRFLKDA